ncbi:DUF1471 domain-containing protein [Serratia plymuthica]|uniref:DUF1471 domain-containing protein n=1 Tax=Serratia plymuthica TaxID=82996 RepID=UPI000935DDAA|nr:DUF1471 domain-containing protein [Serratia plymuthica]OJT37176.1 multiple stress resistance protein BhsA [Serratia plymuthica]
MKSILIAIIITGLGSLNAATAAQLITDSTAKEKIGVISVSNAYTLDDLSNELSRKADKKGATSFKILSATGQNKLHGVAEIYR